MNLRRNWGNTEGTKGSGSWKCQWNIIHKTLEKHKTFTNQKIIY